MISKSSGHFLDDDLHLCELLLHLPVCNTNMYPSAFLFTVSLYIVKVRACLLRVGCTLLLGIVLQWIDADLDAIALMTCYVHAFHPVL